MPEFVRVLTANALRRRCKIGAAFAIAAAASAVVSAPRAEAFDDPLSAEAVDRLVAARSREVLTGRATPIEKIGQSVTIGHEPPQTMTLFVHSPRSFGTRQVLQGGVSSVQVERTCGCPRAGCHEHPGAEHG